MESNLQIVCNAYDSTWLDVPFTNILIIDEWLMVIHNRTQIAYFIDHEVCMFPRFKFWGDSESEVRIIKFHLCGLLYAYL